MIRYSLFKKEDGNIYKKCPKCETEKRTNDFYFYKSGFRVKIDSWCKECEKTATNIRRKKNRAKVKKWNKQYYLNNLSYIPNWRKENKDKVRLYNFNNRMKKSIT